MNSSVGHPFPGFFWVLQLRLAVNWKFSRSSGGTYPVIGRSLRKQLGHATEILNSRCQCQFIPGPVEAMKSKTAQLEDGLEMGEEHLDLAACIT